MKGIIFTNFADFIGEAFGLVVWQNVLDATALEADGSYVGTMTYSDSEFMTLFSSACEHCQRDPIQMQLEFGRWLFPTLFSKSPAAVKLIDNLKEFLFSIDTIVHVEVKKLDPEAKTPSLNCVEIDENTLCIDYLSSRGMGYLAKGLIEGAANHFEQKANVIITPSDNPEKFKLVVTLHD
ncbi:heme NO-binding domain-containing protein [Pseudoalteromonas tunicata]|jgi:hypothetical protein|uniref:Heme NO-binding domain-containing protein n=1 Tax=Pseudoalteromonas tunicata D2 TaxID=87626 RepID=A4CCV0_9GAMM|nr:heme NO-binding domain-containing protein [Pseudoalteromonas tunicata]ATC93899.1 hypothetical protein PTUN_a1242 [Pseudoalteromonas tunicata]AXT29701.1 guanylate cyclase [Pseudoalteromonas tunicata]EAR27393.1 hypothetical protein PTD2_15177 [Pseudoalteromonas tunicata D2]